MPEVLLEYWYRALRSPLGVKVSTTNPTALKARLYSERKSANDPQLNGLMILTSPDHPEQEIWICPRNVEMPDHE